MTCEKCRTDGTRAIYWIRGIRHCDHCAVDIFCKQLTRLKQRFKNLNLKYKSVCQELQELHDTKSII